MADNAYIVKVFDKNDMAFRNGYKVYLVNNPDAADIWILPYDSPDCRGSSYELAVAVVEYPSEAQKTAYICSWAEYSRFKEQLSGSYSGSSSGGGGYSYSDDSSYSSSRSSSSSPSYSSGNTKDVIIGLSIVGAIVLAIAGGIVAYVNWEKGRNERSIKEAARIKYSSISIDGNLENMPSWYKAYYTDNGEEITNLNEIINNREFMIEPIQKDNYVFFDWFDENGKRIKRSYDNGISDVYMKTTLKNEGSIDNYKLMFYKVTPVNPQYATNFYTTGSGGTGMLAYRIYTVKYTLINDGEYYGYLDENNALKTGSSLQTFSVGDNISTYTNEVPTYTLIFQPKNGHKVSFKSFNSSNGKATCYPAKNNAGDTVTLSFKEKNKEFNGYYLDGELLSLDKDYQFAMPDKDIEIEIKFK